MSRFRTLARPAILAISFLGVATSTLAQDDPSASPKRLHQIKSAPLAENLTQTPAGRMFVTGLGALHELRQDAAGNWTSTPIPVAPGIPTTGEACYYTGVTVDGDTLYTLCTEKILNPSAARRSLRALDLKTEISVLREIATFSEEMHPNGLTADGKGHLYFAGMKVFSTGKIHRIKLADRFTVAEEKPIHTLTTHTPNGVHWANGRLYATLNSPSMIGPSKLKSWQPTAEGLTDERDHAGNSFGAMDDFQLIKDGFLVAEFATGKVRRYDLNGVKVGELGNLGLPTSVRVVRMPEGSSAILVSSMLGTASLYDNSWKIEPIGTP